MSITKESGRQAIKIASVDFDFEDIGTAIQTAAVYEAIDLPPGAIVIGGALVVKTAWVGPTVANADVGDTGDDDRYSSTIINLLVAGRTALTLTGHANLVDTIDITYTSTVAVSTAGAARLEVQYFVPDRAESVYES